MYIIYLRYVCCFQQQEQLNGDFDDIYDSNASEANLKYDTFNVKSPIKHNNNNKIDTNYSSLRLFNDDVSQISTEEFQSVNNSNNSSDMSDISTSKSGSVTENDESNDSGIDLMNNIFSDEEDDDDSNRNDAEDDENDSFIEDE